MSTATEKKVVRMVRPPNHYMNNLNPGMRGSAPMNVRKWYMDVNRGMLREIEALYTFKDGQWHVDPLPGDRHHDSYTVVNYEEACKIHEISYLGKKTIFAAFIEHARNADKFPPTWVQAGTKADKCYCCGPEGQDGYRTL